MSGFRAGEIARVRTEIERRLLPEVCKVGTRGSASDGAGDRSDTYAYGADIACRIAPVSRVRGGGVSGGRMDERTTHIFTLPAATAVGTADRLLHEGVYYAVTRLRRYGKLDFTRRVEVMEV